MTSRTVVAAVLVALVGLSCASTTSSSSDSTSTSTSTSTTTESTSHSGGYGIESSGSGSGSAGPSARSISGGTSGWKSDPNTQYHIQTDEGPERYFKYQTISGQYRKEKRLQDGTVVGTYGWVDPNGYLRLRDYVADNTGYRVVKTKMVFVGKDEAIGNAVSKARNVPSQGGVGVTPLAQTPIPISSTTSAPSSSAYPTGGSYPYSIPTNPLLYPSLANSPSNSLTSTYSQQQQYNANPYYTPQQQYNRNPYYTPASDRYDNFNYRQPQPPFPLYDGIAATHNGFRYYLPRQYQEEENLPSQQTAGSFGYIDPFGIRRVIYYNTSPGSGFVHKKNNRYVGFDATPYDPRY